MWWLQLSFFQAIMMDLVVTMFVFVYTMVFSWCYDLAFPVAQPSMPCQPA